MPTGGGWRPSRHKRGDDALAHELLAQFRYSLRSVGRFHQVQHQCGLDALKFNEYGRDLDGEVSY
jgi:hypothetical protein